MFEHENNDPIKIKTPSGEELELMSKRECRNFRFKCGSVGSNPLPGDYNNWTYTYIRDKSLYNTFSDEDKIYIMNKIFEVY
jgi:hypothetical protein